MLKRIRENPPAVFFNCALLGCASVLLRSVGPQLAAIIGALSLLAAVAGAALAVVGLFRGLRSAPPVT